MADKVSNDIKTRLRSAGVKPFKYAKDIGKALLFDSLPNTFSESLPAFNSVYQTSADAAYSISSFARGGASQLKGSVGKMLSSNESTGSMFKSAQNLISDLKTGKLYDKNRDRDDDFFGSSNDSLLDNFGGVDLNYTDDGEYIESGNNDYLGAQKDIAEAESKAADARMKAVVTSIGASTEAQMRASQGMTQASMQLSAKMHDESMNMQKNQLAISSAIYETMNKRLSEMQVMLQEANKSLVTDVSEIKNSLKVIEKAYAPKKDMFGASDGPNPFLGGTLDLREYSKVIKGNIENSPLGMITSMLPMLGMMSGMDSRKKNNPILYLTDFIANALVPKKTKQRMARSNATLEGFFPSLLAKLAEKGEGFGSGSMLASIFGFKEQDIKTINTAKYLKSQTVWTGKDSKALTDVIPTQLAQIISILNGQPMRLFNYDSGKFENAYRAAGIAQASVNNVTMSGEVTNLLNARVNALKFRSNEEKQAFMRYVQEFFNSAVTKGNNINPYSKNFRSGLSKLHGNDRFADILTGLLQTMDKSEMIRFGAEIQQSRASRTSNRNYVNSDLVSSGMIMAFANVGLEGVDEKDQDRLLTAVIQRANNSTRPISVNDIKQIMHRTKSMSNKRKSSVIDVLNDVRNILRRGVISYSYLVSGGPAGEAVTPPGFDDALKDARAARRTMKQRKQGTTGRERTIGGVTDTERNRLLREVARRGDTMSQQRLEEIAEKLGYANTQELKQRAQEYYSGAVRISGNKTVDVTGGKIDPRMIGNMLRGTDIGADTLDSMISELGNERLNETFKKGKSSMQRFRDRITGVTDKLRSPFKLVDYALDFVDSALFKILYGDIPEDLKNKKDDEHSVQSIITASITAQTEKFGNFLNDKLDFIDEKLFGKDGLFNKFKDWAKSKLLGEQDEEGNYVGGKFSDQANAIRSKVREKGGDVYAAMKDAILGSRSGKLVKKKSKDGKYRMVRAYEGGLLQPLRDKFEEFKEYLFGPEGEMTESRKLGQQVAGELKKAAPNMGKGALAGAGITAGAGLLTGLFLPGGPLTGAIIGSAMGLVKSSDKLKKYLFGEEDENGNRKGGIISQRVYEGVKKYGKSIAGGIGIGAALGNFGLLPFGLSNVTGAILGAMGGMVKGSDKLRTMFFGSDDDPNSGVIPKNARKKLTSMIPGWIIGKTTGTALWNIFSSVGLIPGLSLLPGGPILGAIGGIIGAFSKENLERFFFGKKDEDGKRDDSGIFSKMFNGFKDRVIQPIADKINSMGEGIEDWFHSVVEKNMADFFAPMKELFKRGMNKFKQKSLNLVDMLRGAITHVVEKKIGGPLGFLMNLLLGKKDEKGHRKRGIVNITKWVASKPFQLLGATGRLLSRGLARSDARFERKEQRRWNRKLFWDRLNGNAWKDDMGNWHVSDEEEFFAEQDRRRERRGMGPGFWEKAEEFRAKGAEAREKNKAEREARRKEQEKKKREKMAEENKEVKAQSVAVEDGMKKSGVAPGIETIGTNTARTNDFLAAILAQLGGDPSSIQSTTMSQSFEPKGEGEGESGGATSTALTVAGNAAMAIPGVSGVVNGAKKVAGTAKKAYSFGQRLAGLAANVKSRYQTFRDFGILDIPGMGIAMTKGNKNDPNYKKNKYLKDLYVKADRSMTNAADPRKAADEIISQIPEEYSEEGIEIVNRVYDLNFKGGIGKQIGGSDGGDTGLLDTLKGIFSKVSPLAMLLSGITVLFNNLLSGEWLNGILKNFLKPLTTLKEKAGETVSNIVNQGKNLLTSVVDGAKNLLPGGNDNAQLTAGTSTYQQLTAGNNTQYALPAGTDTASSTSTSGGAYSGNNTSSGGTYYSTSGGGNYSGGGATTSTASTGSKFGSFVNKAGSFFKNAAGTVKNMAQTAIGGIRNTISDIKNPMGSNKFSKSIYQGTKIAQALGPLAFGIAGMNGWMLDEDEKSDSKIVNLLKTTANIPEMTIDYATNNGGLGFQGMVSRSLSNNPLNNSIFRGIGELSFSDIKTAATKGADAVADATTKNAKRAGAVAVEGISNIARNISNAFKSALEQVMNNKIVKKFLGSKFGKMITKIASGVASLFSKKLPSVLGKMTAKQSAKVASSYATIHPIAKIVSLILFIIYDAISGAFSDARVYFKVDSKDVTTGMRVASAIAKAAQGALIQFLPYLAIPGYVLTMVAAAIPTDWLAVNLYKIFASDEDKEELEKKQDAYYEQYKAYMQEHYPDLDESEYEEKYSFEKWRRENDKTLLEAGADVVKGGINAVKTGVTTVAKGAVSLVTKAYNKITGKDTETDENKSESATSSTSLSTISQVITNAVSIITRLKIVKDSLGNDTSSIQTAASTAVSNLQNTMTAEALAELSGKLSTDNLDSNITSNFMSGYSSAANIINMKGSSLTVPMRIAAGTGKALSDLTYGAIDAAEFASTLASEFVTKNGANQAKNDAKAAAAAASVVNQAKTMSLDDRSNVSSSDTTSADQTKEKSFGEKIGEAAANAWNTVKSTASNIWSGIKDAASGIASTVGGWFGFGRGKYGRGEYFSQTDPKWNRYDPTMKDAGCGPTVAAMMASHYGRGPKASYTTDPEEANELSKQLGMRDADGGTNPAFFQAYGATKGLNMQEGPADKKSISNTLASGGAVGLMGKGGPFGDNMHYMMADGIDSSNNVHMVDPYGGVQSKQPLSSVVRSTNTAIYGSGRFGRAGDSKTLINSTNSSEASGAFSKTSGNIKTLNTSSAEKLTSKIDESKMRGKPKKKDTTKMDAYFKAHPIKQGKGRRFGRGRWGRGQIESKEQIEKFIQVAQNEIGYLEKASNSNLNDKTANAGYNNYTKYGEWIGYNGDGAYWCHMFVSWCAAQAGIGTDVIPKTALCATGRDFFKNQGRFHMRSGYTPQRGDIVYFTTSGYPNGSGHVGIVTGCDGSNVTTIEGNTSGGSSVVDNGGGVCAKSYSINNEKIYGYGNPNYTGETVMVDGTTTTTDGSTEEGESSEYGGIFGAFQQAFDQIQSQFDAIFAPFTGNSSSSSSSSSSTSSGSLPSGDMLIGDYVKQFESGDAGPRSISSGNGDNGGVSFGTYQFPSYNKTPSGGLLQKFWDTYYASEYPDVTPGNNDAFKQAWLDAVDKDESTFHKREWMISKDGDYLTALNLLKQKFNYDPDKDSRAAQEAIWSTALQGPAIVPGNYQRAFGSTDSTDMDDAEWVKKFYQAKRDMVSQNFRDSSSDVQAGVRSRYEREEPIVAQLAGQAPLQYGQGRGKKKNEPSSQSIYETGGIQRSVNQAVYGMGAAKQNAEVERKIDAIDTQTRAISKAAKSGEFGKGANDTAIQLIADNMVKVVELLTDIRDQTVSANSAASTSGKGKNKYASQNRRQANDPGTVSMKEMALRS